MEVKYNRFKDAPWFPNEDTYILVGGAGGIGSWLSLLLTRAGFKPIVYDFDLLEEHNLAGQLFGRGQIGKPKVEALEEIVNVFCSEKILTYNEILTENSPTNKYVISAFDNMKARKLTFENWKSIFACCDEDSIFIDGRLSAEGMQIFCVTPDKISEYEKHLFEDSEIEDAPCTFKQTSHSAAMIASHIVGFFTNHITNINDGDKIRALPFKWEYFIPMDLLEITF